MNIENIEEEPIKFFKNTLPKKQKGQYNSYSNRILDKDKNPETSAWIFFQIKKKLRAHAILKKISGPKSKKFKCTYNFIINSIKWLESPLEVKDINRLLEKHKIDTIKTPNRYSPGISRHIKNDLLKLITNREYNFKQINNKEGLISETLKDSTNSSKKKRSNSKKRLLNIHNLRKEYSKREDQYQEEVNNPRKTDSTVSKWERKISTGKKALQKAKFLCENTEKNEQHLTFESKRQPHNQYVECHHLIPMEFQIDFGDNSLDRIENIAALCPTCHRKIHHGVYTEANKILEKLFKKKQEGLKKKKLTISLKTLKSYYRM